MHLLPLLRTGWTTFRRTRLIWIFALVAFGVGALDHFLPGVQNDMVILLRYLIVGLVGIYAEAGTIYGAVSALKAQPAAFRQANTVIRQRSIRLVLFNAIPALISAVVPSLLMTIIVMAQPAQPGFGFVSAGLALLNLTIIVIYALLYPFLFFCLSEVIVNNRPFIASLRSGWRIFLANMPLALRISLLFLAAWIVLRAATAAVFLAVQSASAPNPLAGMDLAGILQHLLLSRNAEIGGLLFFALLLDPLKRSVLAQVYLRAADETAPAPASEAERLQPV